jgi:hypothetical protein
MKRMRNIFMKKSLLIGTVYAETVTDDPRSLHFCFI